MSVKIDMRDFKRLDRKFRRVLKAFPKDVDNTLSSTCAEIAGEVWKKTPKVTGSLTQSIQSEKKGKLTYVVESRRKDGKGNREDRYIDAIEDGRGKRLTMSKNKNTKAKANGSGAYGMFKKNAKKSEKLLKKNFTNLLKRLARKI